jgi:phosphatidylglycerophosphate synthase
MIAHLLGPLAPLTPALILSAYFILMFLLFGIKTRLQGMPTDADVTRRSASRLLGRTLRHYLMWVLRPYERTLIRLGVSPNAITFASLLAAMATGWSLATGRFALGGWLYLFTGILDIFDGRIARATGQVSPGGAFFDSVMDRYSELVVFGGLAYFYRDHGIAMVVVFAAMLGSVMVSYSRARAEGLGIDDVNIGTMQRPERLFYLGVITCLAPIPEALTGHPLAFGLPYLPTVCALGILALTANITAARRIMHTMARLEAKAAAVAPQVVVAEKIAPVLPFRAAAGSN